MEESVYEHQYTTGYNQGFLISKFHPELYDQIVKSVNTEQPRFKGMAAGKQAYQREVFIENLNRGQAIKEQHKPRMK